MKLCFPVERNEGLDSPVFGHFGSAPMFVLVDTDTQEVREIANRDLHHAHGACKPLRALGGQAADAIVVGGIGAGALLGLNRAGIKVYQAEGLTIADNLTCLREASLQVLSPEQVCGGHSHGHGCGH
jgi:predicted Fe-Mo cluster-binding NifX family protein